MKELKSFRGYSIMRHKEDNNTWYTAEEWQGHRWKRPYLTATTLLLIKAAIRQDIKRVICEIKKRDTRVAAYVKSLTA